MNDLLLGIGTNKGNRKANLALAHRLLSRNIGIVHRESPIYETAPWGGVEQAPYYNQALWVKTNLSLEEAFRKCQILEQKMGRHSREKWGPRIIDLDLLYYNDEVYEASQLVVPHEQLPNRRFVLCPLYDIAPDYLHPKLQKTTGELLTLCQDTLAVDAIDPATQNQRIRR